MNRKLFRVITVVLAVLIVGQLLNLALQIHSDVYHYSYDEDTFLYTIQDGRYSELPEKKRRNEMEHVKADAQLQECYAVADYYVFLYTLRIGCVEHPAFAATLLAVTLANPSSLVMANAVSRILSIVIISL